MPSPSRVDLLVAAVLEPAHRAYRRAPTPRGTACRRALRRWGPTARRAGVEDAVVVDGDRLQARSSTSLACGAALGNTTSAAMHGAERRDGQPALAAALARGEVERLEVGAAGELVLGGGVRGADAVEQGVHVRSPPGRECGFEFDRASFLRAREKRTAKVAALQPAARAASAGERPSQATRQIASRSRSLSVANASARPRSPPKRSAGSPLLGSGASAPLRAALRRWLASTLPATAYSHGSGCSTRRGSLRHATVKVSAARSSTSSRGARRAKYAQTAA